MDINKKKSKRKLYRSAKTNIRISSNERISWQN